MSRLLRLLSLGLALGCSELTEAEGGVVAIELRVPSPTIIETGETLQLSAVALNRDGDSVAVPITWRAADPTVSIGSETGLLSGISPGTGRVQAIAGTLASPLVSFDVIARADTIILPADSVLTVDSTAAVSPPLQVRLESFSPAGPVSNRPAVFEVIDPVFADPGQRTVELSGGVLIDTLTTGTDGLTSPITVNRVAGVTAPDSAIVQVRASRTRGTPVPGSGQRFIVRFLP